jgi:hypothetical protein
MWIALTHGSNLQYQIYRFGTELGILCLEVLKHLLFFISGGTASWPLTPAVE